MPFCKDENAETNTRSTIFEQQKIVQDYESNDKISPDISHSNSITVASSSNGNSEKEVDYYFNPTELFRWINYRRWDGAKARSLSNPGECSTWIASRHSTDGRILWRHLPLHLVCMQSGVSTINKEDDILKENQNNENVCNSGVKKSNVNLQHQNQIEDLIEVLIETYPEAVSMKDDQGMLPLHLCVSSKDEDMPNLSVLTKLVMIYPKGLEVKDKYGRTPLDTINETEKKSSEKDKVIKMMKRFKVMSSKMAEECRQQNSSKVDDIKKMADNERNASQRIIIRLEQELSEERKNIESLQSSCSESTQKEEKVYSELRTVHNQLATLELDLDQVRKERDELVTKNETLGEKLDAQDNIVSQIRRESDKEGQGQSKTIAVLKSEVNTARAMAEAMEAQLRSKFTNEDFLTNSVSDLESKLKRLNTETQQEKKNHLSEVEDLEQKNNVLKTSIKGITDKNCDLQTRNSEINRYLVNVLNSHSSLCSEYDHMMDTSSKYEAEILERIQLDRSRNTDALVKQKEMLEVVLKEQQQSMDERAREEARLKENIREIREESAESIEEIRRDFLQMRTHASEQELKIQQDTLFSNQGCQKTYKPLSNEGETNGQLRYDCAKSEQLRTPVQSNQVKLTDSSAVKKTSESFKRKGCVYEQSKSHINHTTPRQSNQVNVTSYSPANEKSESFKRNNYAYEASENRSNHANISSYQQTNSQKQSSHGGSSSSGLLTILEQKAAQYRSNDVAMNQPSPSSSNSSANPHCSRESLGHNVSFAPTNISNHSNRSSHPSPVQLAGGKLYSCTPPNSSSVIREPKTSITNEDEQRSFSLDDYSEVSDSIIACNAYATKMDQKQYPGMTAGMKKGMIRVGSSPSQVGGGSASLKSLRRQYGLDTEQKKDNSSDHYSHSFSTSSDKSNDFLS